MIKRASAFVLAAVLLVSIPLRAADDEFKVKRVRLGFAPGWQWSSLGEPAEAGSAFLFGLDAGVMVSDRIEIYASPVFQSSLSVFLFGLGDTYAAVHILLGGYYHLLPPRPGFDLKVGGGLDFADLTFEAFDSKKGTGFWLGAAAELPLRLGFIEPRVGLEARYSVLRMTIDEARDFGGFQVLGTFRLGF